MAAMGVTLWEVAARYLFNAPTSWAHATATCLCGVAFALGGAHAQTRDEHVRIAALYDRFKPGTKRWADIIGGFLAIFYLGGLGLGLWNQGVEAVWRFDWQGKWTPELTPGPPNWPLPAILRIGLVVGSVLFLILVVLRLVALLRSPMLRNTDAHG